ncbi:MAG: YceI family protein [Bacteroidetes bacterium]|nr:YceI family protein [Bacteroidota bacterium]
MKNTSENNKTKWVIDPSHSAINFKVRHLMISNVKGAFKIFDASIYTIGKDFKTAEIDLWIDVSSIDTGSKDRDTHLKSVDFFNVEKHKQINFVSSTIGKEDSDGNHELWGELTMMGITKNVMMSVHFGGIVQDPWGNEKAGFTLSGKINRNLWELNWNNNMPTGGIVVGEEIELNCEIELTNSGQEEKMQLKSAIGSASL